MKRLVALVGLVVPTLAGASPVGAIGDGASSSGEYQWNATCLEEGVVEVLNKPGSAGNIVVASDTEPDRVVAPHEAVLVHGTSDQGWEIFVEGESFASDSGTFSECSDGEEPPPSAPEGLRAASYDARVTLHWRPVETPGGGSPVSDYLIERSLDGVTWNDLGSTGSPVVEFEDLDVVNGTTYYYRVSAKASDGSTGPPSRVVSAVPSATSGTPGDQDWTSTCVGGEWVISSVEGPILVDVTDQGVTLHTGESVMVPPERPGVTVIDLDDPRDFDHLGTSLFRSTVCQPLTYSYTAAPVCVADFPHVRFTATGTGDVYIAQNTHSAGLAEAGGPPIDLPWDEHQAIPFPTTDWDAIRTDTSEVFDSGSFTLAEDNPCVTAPTAPRSLTATPGNGSVRLTWLAPTNNGGAAITDYIIQRRVGTGAWTTANDGVGTPLTRTVTGLTNGTTYQFRVLAKNSAGISAASNVVNSVPRTVPSAPKSLTATPTNVSGQVRLWWLLPASNGGSAITDYIVQRSPNGSTGWVTINDGVRTTTSHTVTGLTDGTRQYFRVLAKNVAGNSGPSNIANAIPRTTPSAPRSLTVTPGNGRAVLRWLAPASNGGAPVTDYIIQRKTGTGSWLTSNDGVRATTGYTITGLRNGTRYYFRVIATNAAGNSPVSNTVNTIPLTVPSAPRLRAYPASGRALLSWTHPTSNGGAATTRYVLQRSTSPTSGWVNLSTTISPTSRSFNSSGLRNGTRYYFRLAAVNAAGTGAWSPVISAAPTALAGSGYYFPNCTAVRQAGAAPLLPTQPGYRLALDRDRDRVACE